MLSFKGILFLILLPYFIVSTSEWDKDEITSDSGISTLKHIFLGQRPMGLVGLGQTGNSESEKI